MEAPVIRLRLIIIEKICSLHEKYYRKIIVYTLIQKSR